MNRNSECLVYEHVLIMTKLNWFEYEMVWIISLLVCMDKITV